MATKLLGRSFVAFTPFLLALIAALGLYLPLTTEAVVACSLFSGGLAITLLRPLFGIPDTVSRLLMVAAVAFVSGGLSGNRAEGVPFLPPGYAGGTTEDGVSLAIAEDPAELRISGRALRDASETVSGLYRVPIRLESVTAGDSPGLEGGRQSWAGRGTLLFRRVDGSQTVLGAPPLFWGDGFSAVGELWCPEDADSCLFLAERVLPEAAVTPTGAAVIAESGLWDRLLAVRKGVRRGIGVSLGRLPGRVRPLTGALVLGDRGFLGSEVVDRFRGAGLSHILALSGMHLGIVAGSAAFLVRRCIGKRGGAIAGMVVAWGYVLLVGPGASLLRAAVMLTVWGLFLLRGRQEHPLNVIGYSFIALTLLWPEGTREIGFSFSYLALGGLFLFGLPFGRLLQRWLPRSVSVPLGASAGAFIATAPLSLALFGFAAPMGIPASVVVAPLVVVVLWTGMVLLIGSLFGTLILPAYWLARGGQELLLFAVILSAEVPVVSPPGAGAGVWGLALLPLLPGAAVLAMRLLRVEVRRRRLDEELLLV